jgi:hypothetical protein
MQVGVIVSRPRGYIIYINDTYARLLSIDPKAESENTLELGVNSRLHIVAQTGQPEINYTSSRIRLSWSTGSLQEEDQVVAVLGLVLWIALHCKQVCRKGLLESKRDV